MTRPQGTSTKLNLPNRATCFAKAKQSTPHLLGCPPGLIRKPVLQSCRGPGKGASALSSPTEKTRVKKAGSVPEPAGSPSPCREPSSSAAPPSQQREALPGAPVARTPRRAPRRTPRTGAESRAPGGGGCGTTTPAAPRATALRPRRPA